MPFRHGIRKLQMIPFEEGGIRSIELPRDRIIKRIVLKFSGSVVVSGGSASGTVVSDAVQRIIPKIEITGDGVAKLFRSDARGLYYKNTLESGVPPTTTPPTSGDAATYGIDLLLTIYFENNLGIRPADTYLVAPRYKTLELAVTWGTLTDMWEGTFDRNATMTTAYGITPLLVETTEPVDVNWLRRQDYIEKEITATTDEFNVDLPLGDGRIYQAIMLGALDAGEQDSTLVNFINFETGSVYKHWQNIPGIELLYKNGFDHHLATNLTSYYYMLLTEDGRAPSGVQTFDVNTAQLKLDVTVGGGTTYLRAYTDFLTRLSG